MPRILAIDWDRHEVRSVLVSSGPTGTSVTGAWVASLTTVDPAGLSGKQIGTRLAAAIGGAVSGKVTTLVGVGRDNVQIKLMTLPPAPPQDVAGTSAVSGPAGRQSCRMRRRSVGREGGDAEW